MSHLRDCILGKGQVFHQDIQAFVLFIQELPDPSVRQTPDIRALEFPGIPRKARDRATAALWVSLRKKKRLFQNDLEDFKDSFRCLSKCTEMRYFCSTVKVNS